MKTCFNKRLLTCSGVLETRLPDLAVLVTVRRGNCSGCAVIRGYGPGTGVATGGNHPPAGPLSRPVIVGEQGAFN